MHGSLRKRRHGSRVRGRAGPVRRNGTRVSARRRRNRLATVAVAALLAAALYFGAVLGLQRPVTYPRPPRPPSPPTLPAGARQVWLGPNRDWEAWLLQPAAGARQAAVGTGPVPLIIYTHGNGELIDHWAAPFAAMTDAGVAVLLVEYPGYGRSGGRPSRDSISAAIIAAFDFASARADIDAQRIAAYGRSLGGAAACELAAARPVAALILESTFTRMSDLMPWFVPRALVLDPFDSMAVIAAGAPPVLVLHGVHDRVIPFAHGETLARAAGTEPVALPCGHNGCPRQWPLILAFLRRHALID